MTEAALWAGMSPAQVAELDADEFDALIAAINDKRRADSWTSLHESVAAVVEALWAILGRLEAGVGTMPVAKLNKPQDRGAYPRPEWVSGVERAQVGGDDGVLVVTSVREALNLMKSRDG